MESAMRNKNYAFTLIEILAVIAIFSLLLVIVVPAIGNLTTNFEITRQGQTINDHLILARQTAITRNRDVQLRFFQSDDADPKWSLQLWELKPPNNQAEAISRKLPLPDSVILSTPLSPILAKSLSGTLDGATWYALHFRANGRLAAQLNNENNYLTLQTRHASESAPSNYYTLQINPLTGRVTTYRP